MGKWLAIANPYAGALRDSAFADTWMPRIRQHVDTLVYTEAPGHATAIACAARGYDGIAVIGGDGTLFEVLAGVSRDGPRLAVIPAGRGNCLALDLGVDTVPRALQAIDDAVPVNVDLMAVELEFADGRRRSCRAASTLALGYAADTVARAAQLRRAGRYAYVAAAVCTRPRRTLLETAYGDTPPRSQTLSGVIVNNTRHLANFIAFPHANCCDGVLDVLELDVGWPRQMLHNAAVLSRSYFYRPGRELQTPDLRVRLHVPGRMMIDGELLEAVSAFEVRCEPAAARFVRRRAT